ncbi:MAG: serine hydrolase domain-containing protein [Lentimicrobium sp.]
MKKKILYSILIVLFAGLTAGVVYINSLLPVITGYAAKNLASAVFVSGRSQADVEALDLNFSVIRYTSNEVDTIQKKVTSRFLWGKSTAIYREGFGCTIVHGSEEISLRKVKFPDIERPAIVQDSLEWPLGNIIPLRIISGTDLAKLQEISVNLVEKDAYNGHAFAFMVVHKGYPIVERYRPEFDQKTRFLSWSMAKSFTNALAGIMVKDGKIDINKPADIPEWQNDDRKKITINNLLQMQSGLKWNEDYGSGSDVNLMLHRESDFAAFVAGHQLKSAPGTEWYYSSGSTNLVSGLIRKAINNDDEYFRLAPERLFNRIGMPDAVFETDASGTLVGSSYVYATARDFARFALLYLQDGVFKDERILPEGWVKYTTTPVSGSDGAYGSSFWLNMNNEFPDAPASMYYCKGHDGQRIFIIPDKKLAVIILGYSPKPDNVMDFNRLLGDVLAAFN